MAAQPNILMIMADQLTALALPAYGHPVVAGAAPGPAGRRGRRCSSTPTATSRLCAPSRASLMSGRLASRIGVYDNAAEFPALGAHRGARAPGAGLPHLPRRQDALRRPRSAARLRGAADHRHLPGRFRLDAQLGCAGGADRLVVPQHGARSSRPASPRPPTSSTSTTRSPSRPSAGWPTCREPATGARSSCAPRSPTRTTPTRCRGPIGTATATTRSICPNGAAAARGGAWTRTAAGWRASADMAAVEITEADVRRARHAYYGEIAYVDDQVGRLLAALERFGLTRDTVVLVTADHGEMLGERGLWYKMHFFEWALRVPLIVWRARPVRAATGGGTGLARRPAAHPARAGRRSRPSRRSTATVTASCRCSRAHGRRPGQCWPSTPPKVRWRRS